MLVFHCFLCTLWLCLWDFSKCFAKWTTQLFICRFLVRVSYLEIYNEEVRDLLGKDQTQRLEVSFLFWMWYLFWIRAIFRFKDQRSTCREMRGWAPQLSSFLCNAIAGCHCWLLWISSTWSVAQTDCSTWGSFVPAVLPQRPLSSPWGIEDWDLKSCLSPRGKLAYCYERVFIPYLLGFQVECSMCKPEKGGVNHYTVALSLELLLGIS